MRQIKFRAWDGSLMLFFSLDSLRDNFGDDCCMTPKGEDAPPHSGLNWPVMQFTGLQDSKGVDIYEGDIAVLREFMPRGDGGFDDLLTECKWCNEHSGFALSGIKPFVDVMALIIDVDCEVIGNIYENPELLT